MSAIDDGELSYDSHPYEPPPAEVICDLDLMGYEMRGFGASCSLTGKKRRKAQLRDAARLLDEGRPFIFDGRRIPGHAG